MDMNKLDKAIIYVDRIANGVNPVNNSLVVNDSVLNDPNVIRCMYFIKEILKEVKENGGVIGKNNLSNIPFDVNLLNKFVYIEDKSITNVIKQINEYIDNSNMKKIKSKVVLDWLKDNDYISNKKDDETGLTGSIVTEKGKMVGIYNEVRSFNGREYIATIYNKQGQEFIIDILKNYIL